MGRVYSYTRFSDPKQAAGSSSDRQAAYAARWAAEHGLELDESLSLRDEGLSAYHQRHIKSGALGTFLAAIDQGRVPPGSVLVVEALDRLSRAEPIQAQAQLAQIVNAGIRVVTASDGREYSRETLRANPMDLIYSLLVMIRAHEESDTKSKRVKASIQRLCDQWVEGTGRTIINVGRDPKWLRRVDPSNPAGGPQAWELIPERVEAVRFAIDMYLQGHGATHIVEAMRERGLSATGEGTAVMQVYRMIQLRSLIGDRELEVNGTPYLLPDYYPAIISRETWDELRVASQDRYRRKTPQELPAVITGLGIATCGYCGTAVVNQTLYNRKKLPDGRIRPCHRRLRCVSNMRHDGRCIEGSASVVPIERAIMSYCSDIINLRSLVNRDDRAADIRARLSAKRAELEQVEQQLTRLLDVLLTTASPPATITAKMAELEAQAPELKRQVAALEGELASSARVNIEGHDQLWRDLAHGVEYLDPAARLKARQLVADTFSKIVIWHTGVEPYKVTRGPTQKPYLDILLVPKGSARGRLLRVDADGGWVEAEELEAELPVPDDLAMSAG